MSYFNIFLNIYIYILDSLGCYDKDEITDMVSRLTAAVENVLKSLKNHYIHWVIKFFYVFYVGYNRKRNG